MKKRFELTGDEKLFEELDNLHFSLNEADKQIEELMCAYDYLKSEYATLKSAYEKLEKECSEW